LVVFNSLVRRHFISKFRSSHDEMPPELLVIGHSFVRGLQDMLMRLSDPILAFGKAIAAWG